VTAAPPRLLGPRFRGGNERGGGEKRRKSMEEPEKRERVLIWRRFISSFSRRRPGPRDHRALDGSQKDIKPPQPPRHGGCCSFKGTRASCQRKARCAEVRSVAAAPSRSLDPRFRGGNERARTRTSRRSNVHCAEVRSVAAAPPRLLGPRFRGGNERGVNPSIAPVECSLR